MSWSSLCATKKTWNGYLPNAVSLTDEKIMFKSLNNTNLPHGNNTKRDVDIQSVCVNPLNPLAPCFVPSQCVSNSSMITENNPTASTKTLNPYAKSFNVSKIDWSPRIKIANRLNTSLNANAMNFEPKALDPFGTITISESMVQNCNHTNAGLEQVLTTRISDDPDFLSAT